MSPGKRLRIIKFVIFTIFLIGFTLIDVTDGWKLRDLTQKNDENKVTLKKPNFRDMPMKKIVNIVKSNDDNDGDDDNDATETADDDDDDDNNFVFEKVHSTHFELKPLKHKEIDETDDSDDSDDINNGSNENDDNESPDNNSPDTDKGDPEQENSIFSSIFNIFSKDKSEDDDESPGFFDWLRSLRKSEEAKEQSSEKNEPDVVEEKINWLSYLDRKPFNLISNYFATDNSANKESELDGDDAVEPGESTDNNNNNQRKPLTTEHFEHLLLNIPSFVPNYTNIDDIDCKRMGQIFQRQVRGQKLWALQSK